MSIVYFLRTGSLRQTLLLCSVVDERLIDIDDFIGLINIVYEEAVLQAHPSRNLLNGVSPVEVPAGPVQDFFALFRLQKVGSGGPDTGICIKVKVGREDLCAPAILLRPLLPNRWKLNTRGTSSTL